MKRKKQTALNVLIILVYVIINVFLMFNHEAWRDESQAWILAKNSSFGEILNLCSSEGHPFLWFYLIKICGNLGLSFYYFSTISIIIMTIATFLFLQYSPFSLFSKICIVLSPIFFYYNPVICRIYSVVILLVVFLCILWPKRIEHPIVYGVIVAILFQSHVLMAGLAIGCLVELILQYRNSIKKKINILGIFIPVISMICLFFELKQTRKSETFIHVNPLDIISNYDILDIPKGVYSVFRNFDYGFLIIGTILFLIFFALLIIFLTKYFKDAYFRNKTRDLAVVFLFAIVYYFGIMVFVRKADHVQISIVLLVIVLFFVWIITDLMKNNHNLETLRGSNEKDKQKKFSFYRNIYEKWLIIFLLIMIPQSSLIDPLKDLKGQYSGSLEMAKIIETTVSDDSIIVLHNNMYSTSIVAYLYESKKKITFWDIDNGCEYKIHKWGKINARTINEKNLLNTIFFDNIDGKKIFYLYGTDLDNQDYFSEDGLVLIGSNSSTNKWSEYYQLYVIVQ